MAKPTPPPTGPRPPAGPGPSNPPAGPPRTGNALAPGLLALLDRVTDPAVDAIHDAMQAVESIQEEITDPTCDMEFVLAMAYEASAALERLERLYEEKRG